MGSKTGFAVSSGAAVASECSHCHQKLGERQVWFDRRVQVAFFGEESISIQVLYADGVEALCSLECWQARQQEIFKSMGLVEAYPDIGRTTPCCRCGVPVDRQSAHVSYVVMEVTNDDKPWLKSCTVSSDEEYAVLCNGCEFPAFESEVEEIDEPEIATEKSQREVCNPVEKAEDTGT